MTRACKIVTEDARFSYLLQPCLVRGMLTVARVTRSPSWCFLVRSRIAHAQAHCRRSTRECKQTRTWRRGPSTLHTVGPLRGPAAEHHHAPESSPRPPARDTRLIAELIRYTPGGQGPDVTGREMVLQ